MSYLCRLISSRVFNRQSVQKAIRMIQKCLGQKRAIPENGIALFYGCLKTGEEIKKELTPPLPIRHSVYICDSSFHIDSIIPLYDQPKSILYLTVGNCKCILFSHTGTQIKILTSIEIDLPTSTRRGGQSANRLARIRNEKRHLLLKKIVESLPKGTLPKGSQIKNDQDSFNCDIIITGHGSWPDDLSEMLMEHYSGGMGTKQGLGALRVNILGTAIISGNDPIHESIQSGQDILSKKTNEDLKNISIELKELIRQTPDSLAFGLEEVKKFDELKYLSKVYISSDIQKDNKLTVENLIILPGYIIDMYGGVVGVLHKGLGSSSG